MELREHPRHPVDLPVLFATPESFGVGLKSGSLFNLSFGGCAVTSLAPVGVDTELTLFIQVPVQSETIKVDKASVRWSSGGEFGLQFQSLRPHERLRLSSLLGR